MRLERWLNSTETVAEGMDCSYCPHGGLQPSATPVPKESLSFSDHRRHQVCTWHAHRYALHSLIFSTLFKGRGGQGRNMLGLKMHHNTCKSLKGRGCTRHPSPGLWLNSSPGSFTAASEMLLLHRTTSTASSSGCPWSGFLL